MAGSGLEAWDIQRGHSGLLSSSPGSHRHPMLPTLLEGVAMQTVLSFWAKVAPMKGRGQQKQDQELL